MRALQKELDELREVRQREKERESLRAQEDEDEINNLRDRCDRLEEERENQQGDVCGPISYPFSETDRIILQADMEMVDQLRSDMEGLLSELDDLARRNDDLMAEKDSDTNTIRDLDLQLKDYKRKYEQAKTELRSVKGSFILYVLK